jgi:hypothetical protein
MNSQGMLYILLTPVLHRSTRSGGLRLLSYPANQTMRGRLEFTPTIEKRWCRTTSRSGRILRAT